VGVWVSGGGATGTGLPMRALKPRPSLRGLSDVCSLFGILISVVGASRYHRRRRAARVERNSVAKADSHIEVISRGVLTRDGKVLLCRNEKGGYFYLPGGHLEFDESAAAALAREFEEECGIRIVLGDCVLVTEASFEAGRRRHHEVN